MRTNEDDLMKIQKPMPENERGMSGKRPIKLSISLALLSVLVLVSNVSARDYNKNFDHTNYRNHSGVEKHISITVPMDHTYYNKKKSLRLNRLIKRHSSINPHDYKLDRVLLTAAAYRNSPDYFLPNAYAYLKNGRYTSDVVNIPHSHSYRRIPRVRLNADHRVRDDHWRLVIGPGVTVDQVTLILKRKNHRGSHYADFRGHAHSNFNTAYVQQHQQDWHKFASIRSKKSHRRDRQLRIPNGTHQVKLVADKRDTDILHAWVSYSDGSIQRLTELQGTVYVGQSLNTAIRLKRASIAQATLHLVFKPHRRGHRSYLTLYSA